MQFDIFYSHLAIIAVVLILIYGHETSYGFTRTIEAIKLRRAIRQRFNFYTNFYEAERAAVKTLTRKALLGRKLR